MGQQQKAEEMRKELLQKIMVPEALDRIKKIGLVKPDKARKLEDHMLQMAQKGQIKTAITDNDLKQMLEGIAENEKEGSASTVSFDRRRYNDDDDDDMDDLLEGL